MIDQQAMLVIVSLSHDTSTSNVNDRVTMIHSMIDQQAMLTTVSLFHDTSTCNVNDRVSIP